MALTKCKECGNMVSSTASSCPNCGAPIKKKTSILTWIVAVILVSWLIGYISSQIDSSSSTDPSSSSSSEPSVTTYKIGQTAHIGYTSYAVWKAEFRDKLSDNPYLNQKPNASYLFIDLTVRNDDKQARTIAPFKLVDENGATYDSDSTAMVLPGAIGVLDDLNPGVQKQGFIVFDVPKNHHYKLEISGGYWSPDKALVDLGL